MIRIGTVILKAGYFGGYENHLVVQENGRFVIAAFRHVGGPRYERLA